MAHDSLLFAPSAFSHFHREKSGLRDSKSLTEGLEHRPDVFSTLGFFPAYFLHDPVKEEKFIKYF